MKKRFRSGVSELTATILLAIIIISVGGLVLINYYSSWSEEWRTYASSYEKAVKMLNEAMMSLIYGYYNVSSGSLVLVLSIGSGGGAIDTIYVNDELYWRIGESGLIINNIPKSDASLPPTATIVEILVNKKINARLGEELRIKIITTAGNVYTFSVVTRE